MLSKYSNILLDVSQTLYDNNNKPLRGSKEFLKKYKDKIIIISNIGSTTGEELKIKLYDIYNINIKRVITSLDLVIQYCKRNKIDNIFHYGSDKTLNKLRNITDLNFIEDHSSNKIENILFTSLCTDLSWISLTQNTLNIMTRNNMNIILGNPDRSCPIKPHNFTVSLIYDALFNSCQELGYKPSFIEIGKPNIDIKEIGLSKKEKTIIIGDNPNTDGLLALKNNIDYIQVGNSNVNDVSFRNILKEKVNTLEKLI